MVCTVCWSRFLYVYNSVQASTVTGVPWREMTLRPRALPEIVHSDDGSLHTWHSISCNFAHERKSQSAFYTYRGRWGSILSYSPLDPPLRKTHGPIAIAISRSVRRMSVLANISKIEVMYGLMISSWYETRNWTYRWSFQWWSRTWPTVFIIIRLRKWMNEWMNSLIGIKPTGTQRYITPCSDSAPL